MAKFLDNMLLVLHNFVSKKGKFGLGILLGEISFKNGRVCMKIPGPGRFLGHHSWVL